MVVGDEDARRLVHPRQNSGRALARASSGADTRLTLARPAVLAAALLGAASASAQYRFDNWTTDDGLPQNSVRGILQTRDGYLWFTTFDGLVRFDGVRFTVFRKGNTPGVPSNRFLSLFEDKEGDLWASLESGDVVRRHHGRFTTYRRPETSLVQVMLMDDGHGHALAYDSEYAEQGNRVLRLHLRFHRFEDQRLVHAPELDRSFPVDFRADARTGFLVFLGREIWLGQPGLLTRLTDGHRLPLGEGSVPVATVLSRERATRVLVRDAAGGLWLWDTDSLAKERISSRAPETFDQTGAKFVGVTDAEGNHWLASNGGLFRARKETLSSLGSWETYPLAEGRDGTVWIGTSATGLYRFRDGALSREQATDQDAILSRSAIESLYVDRAGHLWINGFWRLEGKEIRFESRLAKWVVNRDAYAMCEDGEGAIWRGTQSGVLRSRGERHHWYTTADGLAGDHTTVIIGDGRDGLWIGSTGGLTHWAGGRFTAYTEKEGLPGTTVRALKLDADGTLWIGTYDSGLGRLKDGRFTRVTAAEGLFDDGVFMVLEDDAGWFWMSSNRGLYRARRQELVDVAEGRTRRVSCIAYSKSDGMPSTECNGGRWPAGLRTRDGKLMFPTMAGVAVVDPSRVRSNLKPPPVVIEGMRIGREPVLPEEWGAARRGEASIRVLPGQESFEVDYTALSFIGSEYLRFRYRLEGAERGWVDAGARRTAHYGLVPPGSYTFRVIAANSDGVWNEKGAHLGITVVPPFHRTWWFRTLSALALALLVGVAWTLRVRQLRSAQAAEQEAQQRFARQLIESQESERKRIAAELHDSLGHQLLLVKQRAQLGLAASEVPKLHEQLGSIAASAGQTLDEVRGIAQNLRPYHLDYLGLAKALEVMIDNVAATTTTRIVSELETVDDLIPKEDAITLYRIVQESLNNVVKHSGATEARVAVQHTDGVVTLTVTDDGKGFAIGGPSRAGGFGFGLSGMAERVRMLGGELRVESSPGRGTTVIVRLALR